MPKLKSFIKYFVLELYNFCFIYFLSSYSQNGPSSMYLPPTAASSTYEPAVLNGTSRSSAINTAQLTAALGQQQQQQTLLGQKQQQPMPYQHHLSPENAIYGSLLVKNITGSGHGGQAVYGSVGRHQSTADEVAQLNNFEENFCQALNMMEPSISAASSSSGTSSSRLNRFRIPSSSGNSNTVNVNSTMSRSSGKVAPSSLGVLESSSSRAIINPNITGVSFGLSALQSLPLQQSSSASNASSGMFYHGSGSNHGSGQIHLPSSSLSCGDRSSLVSSTGLPAAPLEIKWIRCTKDGSPGSPILDPSKAKADDYRLISIERSSALLGIQILQTTKSKGVFVKMVTDGSLARQAGIQVGDQIIDICGINMRTADYENAAKVLKQCGDPIQMLVQYQYDKFKEIWSSMTKAERCTAADNESGNMTSGPTSSSSQPPQGSGKCCTFFILFSSTLACSLAN